MRLNQLVFEPDIPGIETGRTDIAGIFIPDLIKVDLSTGPARLAGGGPGHPTNPDDPGFSPLSIFGGDTLVSRIQPGFGNGVVAGGWPNGRRFGDDVLDIAVTAIISDLRVSPAIVRGPAGDNVNRNDMAFNKVFPYDRRRRTAATTDTRSCDDPARSPAARRRRSAAVASPDWLSLDAPMRHATLLESIRHAALAFFAAAGILGFPVAAVAHNPGLSSLELRVGPSDIVADLSIAAADAAALVGSDADVARIGSLALQAIDLQIDGRQLEGLVDGIASEEGNAIRVRLRYGARRIAARGHVGRRQPACPRPSAAPVDQER